MLIFVIHNEFDSMKDFVKMMLAVICAFIVMQLVGFFLLFIMIGSVAALGSGKTVLPREGVLDIDMAQFTLGEQTLDDQFSPSPCGPDRDAWTPKACRPISPLWTSLCRRVPVCPNWTNLPAPSAWPGRP